MKIGIIVSQFNSAVTDKLLEGAERGLKDVSRSVEIQYDVVRVPGAFEIPLAALKMAKSGHYDALIVLGVVVKGETDHYEMVCRVCTDGIREVMMTYEIPVAFEVLMVHDVQLAFDRAGDRTDNNKGYSAAQVIVQTLISQ